MFLIALVVAAAIFTFLLAFYNFSNQENIKVSNRINRFANTNSSTRRAVPTNRKGFWADYSNSRISGWTSQGASRFGNLLPKREWFDLQVERAGLPITGTEFLTLSLGSAVVWFLLMLIATGNLFRAIVIALAWFAVCTFYVKYMANSRMKAFDMQLNDAVVMMSNALKAGFTFQQAMDVVAKELDDPISTEFNRALGETQLGMPLEDALNGICSRIKSEDFDLIATAVIIQRQVGGNLSQIMDTIGTTIRERIKLNGEIKALTAEGVMSGWALAILPIALSCLLLFINPKYFDGLLASSYGLFMMGFALVSEVIGVLIIRRMVNMKI